MIHCKKCGKRFKARGAGFYRLKKDDEEKFLYIDENVIKLELK
jgi:hypothetical protein